jgi:NAD(P)-dependent dehydrogenase (short-subunit alcohol dehydrogenase family)
MLTELRDIVVFVTGGARRVGRGIVLGFAAQGAHVVIHHGSSDGAAAETAAAARAFGVEALVVKADLTERAQLERAFAQARNHFPQLHVLVNNAANYEKNDLLEIEADEWNKVIEVNLNAPFWATQHAGRWMREQGIPGSIINIADNYGLRPSHIRPHHSVSKAGLIMLTQVTARALARYQIRANCLVLGPIIPGPGTDEATWAAVEQRLPLKRSGDVDDVARAAVFLAANDFITGAVLRVDGGEWLGDATDD